MQGERIHIIDLEKTRNDAGKIAKGHVVKLVDMTKAQALESLGEDEGAVRLMKRYL